MNITPNKIIKGKNSDGTTFRLEEWDYSTLVTLEFIPMVITFLVGLALSSVIPSLLFILCVTYFNGKVLVVNLLGIITSLYFLYDCSQGWWVLQALTFFVSESTIGLLHGFTIGALIGHVCLLLFGDALKNYLLVLLVTVSIIGFGITATTHKKGWVDVNTRPVEEPVDTRPVDEIIKANEKAYGDSREAQGLSRKNEFDN